MLNDPQKNKIIEIWDAYIVNGKKFINASREFTQMELDKKREEVIIVAKKLILDYIQGQIALESFKSEIDGLNKRNRLWGFKGINGQMYFNMLYNSSMGAGLLDKLDVVLKQCFTEPADIADAIAKIKLLAGFSESLSDYASDKRQAPRTGSCNFFISYFWQIQDHARWPIYYKSMVDVLNDANLWSPSGDHTKDYEEFYQLNAVMKTIIERKTGKPITLWDVEHALWLWGQKDANFEESPKQIVESQFPAAELPTSFIPPVVSVIPLLAKNDGKIAETCEKAGISVEKAFEEKIALLLKMLGYRVENMGQGYGRVPDGIAVSSEFHYAVIYDAKVRTDGYSVGTDDRAFREYIFHETERLRRQGIRNVYFMVVSSSFRGDYDILIRSLKMETEIREIIFMEATALLTLLEQKLRNSDLDLGPKGIQGVFAQSDVFTNADMKEFLGV